MTSTDLEQICDKNNYSFDRLEQCLKEDGISIDDIYESIIYLIAYKYRKFICVDDSMYDIQVANMLNKIAYYNESGRTIGKYDFIILCNLCNVNDITALVTIAKKELDEEQRYFLNFLKVILKHLDKLVDIEFRADTYNLLCVTIDTEYKYTKDEAVEIFKYFGVEDDV